MKDWSLKARLAAGFGSLLAVVGVVAVVGWTQMSLMWDGLDNVANNVVPSYQALVRMRNAIGDRRRFDMRHFMALSAAEKTEYEAVMEKKSTEFRTAYDTYEKSLIADAEDRRLLQEVGASFAVYVKAMDEDLAKSRAAAGNSTANAAITALLPAEQAKFEAVSKAIEAHFAYNEKLAAAATAAADSAHKRAQWLMAGFALFGLVVSVAMSLVIGGSIFRQVGGEPSVAAAVAHRVAGGDLTGAIPLHPGDTTSLLANLKEMQDSLRGIVGTVKTGVVDLAQSMGQFDEGSREAAHASTTQADATASMAAAIEELSVSVSHLADSSRQATMVAEESTAALDRGVASVETSVQAMRLISNTVGHTADNIRLLGDRSKEITAIVGVIKDIAEQTNLLALNAAIEAARAGEQGRGFAVVADEVRKLAERTTQSTQQITQTVDAIVNGTQSAVDSMNSSSKEVASGLETAAEALGSMERIKAGTNTIISALRDVSAALDEQRGAGQQIAQNVEKVATMTEENNAAVRGLATTAQSLNEVSGRLRPIVERFKV